MDYRILIIAPITALVLSAGAATLRMPAGWSPGPPVPQVPAGYEIGLDPRPDPSGLASLTVRSIEPPSPQSPGLGAALQWVYGYAGQRVRLSGQVRAEGVPGWAGLYIGVGEHDMLSHLAGGKPGVEQRLPKGAAALSAGWQDVSVVFDVPADAPAINFGLALAGEGQVWARALRFEVVGTQVPVTTTSIGFDWARARAIVGQGRQQLAQIPPKPLTNPALD